MAPIADWRAQGEGRLMELARILAYVTGTVDQELLARNEYLAAENRILKGPVERSTEALGRRAGRARRDRLSPGPQGSRRGRNCGPAGHLWATAVSPSHDGAPAALFSVECDSDRELNYTHDSASDRPVSDNGNETDDLSRRPGRVPS